MKKIFALLNLPMALMFLYSISTTAQYTDEMFHGNPAHNKNYTGFDDKIFSTIAWKFKTGGAIRSTAIAIKDIIYFGSSDGYLYALNKINGEMKWKYNCGRSLTSSPAYSNGLIYILSERQELFAIESSPGKLKWKIKIGEDKPYDWGFDYYFSSPVINGDT